MTDLAQATDWDTRPYTREFAQQKYGSEMSPYLAARFSAGYSSPEDHYESLMSRNITCDTTWLDVGCGRAPFPNNLRLSSEMSQKCRKLVGIDPDIAVIENEFLNERHCVALDDFRTDERFDLVTARMVVEHVQSPKSFATGLARVTSIGSHVVLFTVNWYSLMTLAAHYTPLSVHNHAKRLLWNTDEKDTFPTVYRMNQRHVLRSVLEEAGFAERHFITLADASLLWKFPKIRRMEIGFWKLTSTLGLPYPDSCILAVYERVA